MNQRNYLDQLAELEKSEELLMVNLILYLTIWQTGKRIYHKFFLEISFSQGKSIDVTLMAAIHYGQCVFFFKIMESTMAFKIAKYFFVT